MSQLPGRKLTAHALSERGANLSELDWRLLFWLLRYPLQQTDDMVLGVARWASRATVYRHVQALETNVLVESALPKTPGSGKRLYYLSNPGLHLLARHLDKPAVALARKWQADEAGIMRLLPRLPTLLVLQDVINGLVTHAANAMTTRGSRPELVRWTWQRDVTHQFLYRERSMRFFADGILALLIRTRQSGGDVQDQWFGVVLLSTMLDDERLMRLRLERLVCWRESPERWSCYQHMLPVLILAKSQRQRDHWQNAVAATALKLRLDPLLGALICHPFDESARVNPWLLNWHTLATRVSAPLRELLKPLPRAAFPSSLLLGESKDENREAYSTSNEAARSLSFGAGTRFSRLVVGNLIKRTTHATTDGVEELEVVSLLGLRLTPCQWSIVYMLLEHPLLSDEELAIFLGLQRKTVRCALYELHQLGCLEPVVTDIGKRWHLCERGLRLIAAANHMHIRNIAVVPFDETGRVTSTMVPRGESWLFQHIQHTAGIYGFFARLSQAARKEPDQAMCWWETEVVCERRYQIGEQWYNLRPDALAEYRVGEQQFRFWLEWDRGTMNARDLATKFVSYAHYIDSREWVKEWLMLPRLFCIAPDIAQERRVQRVAQARLAHIPGLVLWTTTEVLLREQGPLAPIWLQGIPQRSQVAQPRALLRHCIADMAPEKHVT